MSHLVDDGATPLAADSAVAGALDDTAARPSALARYDLARPVARWRLPLRLREISGLAVTDDGRLLGHDDERGVVYEIDYRAGAFVKAFALGSTPARDDFEGIAVARGRVYLVSSGGRVYAASEGPDDARVPFEAYATDVGRACEVEGLAHNPDEASLLLLCKTPRARELAGAITIFRWSLDARAVSGPPLRLPYDTTVVRVPRRGLRPSGIERDPVTGHYLVVSARDGLLLEVTPDGVWVGARPLARSAHPQTEGIAIAPDLTLILADEGRDGRALVGVYAPREARSGAPPSRTPPSDRPR